MCIGIKLTSIFTKPALGIWLTLLNKLHASSEQQHLNSGKSYCRAVQHLVSCRLLSKNVRFKMHKTVMLLSFLYGHGN
jgi:hypothetical protein